MEERKKKGTDQITRGGKDIYDLLFKSNGLIYLVLILIILSFCGFITAAIGVAIAFMIFFLSVQAVKRTPAMERLIMILLFVAFVTFMKDLLLEPGESFSVVTIFVIIVLTIFVFPIVSKRIMPDTKSIEIKKKEIGNVGELIAVCLKSEYFDFLLILVYWLFFFMVAFQKLIIMTKSPSGDLPLKGLVIVFGYLVISIVSFLLVFTGMYSSTKNVKKNFLSVFVFAIIIIIMLIISSISLMLIVPDLLTPSSGL